MTLWSWSVYQLIPSIIYFAIPLRIYDRPLRLTTCSACVHCAVRVTSIVSKQSVPAVCTVYRVFLVLTPLVLSAATVYRYQGVIRKAHGIT